MDLQAYFSYLASFLAGSAGSFLLIDLIAATADALNSAILAQRPDYYRGRQWSVVGILLLAIFGGIGGGVSRCAAQQGAGGVDKSLVSDLVRPGWRRGDVYLLQGRPEVPRSLYQFMTAFSLPWYAAIGVQAALNAGLPDIAAIAIGVVGPTAGRFLIDITAGKSAKQFIRGEWFVGTAVLTSVTYLICAKYIGLTIYPATLIAFLVGFSFRVAALWFAWEEPLPRRSEHVREIVPRRSLKEKMQPDWEPKYD